MLITNTGLSNDSIVNLLKIKKGYENAVYAALTYELDATLKNSKKKWLKVQFKEIDSLKNNLTNYVKGPKELNLILSQIGFIDDLDDVLTKQKQLKIGQSLVNKHGVIWRWDGFVSEDNLQNKKLIDAQIRIKKLIEEQSTYQVKLNNLEIKKSLLKEQSENDRIFKEENINLEKFTEITTQPKPDCLVQKKNHRF